MDFHRPLDLSRERRAFDDSGTPSAFMEQLRRAGQLVVLESVDDSDVAVEFPMGRIWREETGCERFVRLRRPLEGKVHALVTGANLYPDKDPVGARLGLAGAGILAYMTGDQLHPPMVDDPEMWSDGLRWRDGAIRHTLEAAVFSEVRRGERVLDIGCGVGGPARALVDRYGVHVLGVSTNPEMVRTAMERNQAERRWRERIVVMCHDCQRPYPQRGFDLGWSMNMLYQVQDHARMLACAHEALLPEGRLMIEDWMFTETATPADANVMQEHFGRPGFKLNVARIEELRSVLLDNGYSIRREQDLGHIARRHLGDHFMREFDAVVRPRLEADFGDDGRRWADQMSAGIEATIRLYRSGALTYRRLLAVRL